MSVAHEALADLLTLVDEMLGTPEEDFDELLDELVPELTILCQNTWLLELVLTYCSRRNQGAE